MCTVAAVAAAGIVMSAAGTAMQVQQQRAQADFQAQQLEQEAQAERTAQALRSEDRRRRFQRTLAEQRVLFGASGTAIDPNILAQTAEEFAREEFNDRFNLVRSVNALQGSAASARASGANALTSGLLSFGTNTASSLLTSGALDTSTTLDQSGQIRTDAAGRILAPV